MLDQFAAHGVDPRCARAIDGARHNDSDTSLALRPGPLRGAFSMSTDSQPPARQKARSIADFWPAVAERVQHWLARARREPARRRAAAAVCRPAAPGARGLRAPRRLAAAHRDARSTLAASLAPAAVSRRPARSHSIPRPTASAPRRLLRGQAAGAAWARRDPRRLRRRRLRLLLRTAQALLRGAHERAPPVRAAYWAALREATGARRPGPGASERWLARMALEWAASADAPAADVLWTWRPGGLGRRAGAAGAMRLPMLWLAAARRRGDPGAVARCRSALDRALRRGCAPAAAAPPALRAGSKTKPQAATLAVLEALDDDRTPVALIAQDRLVVRRIRALLERAEVTLHDETGWTLSTTRAAARLMALLRAAAPGAGRDAVLDWLKAEASDAAALAALESQWRRGGDVDGAAASLWRRGQAEPAAPCTAMVVARWRAGLLRCSAAASGAAAGAGRGCRWAATAGGVAPRRPSRRCGLAGRGRSHHARPRRVHRLGRCRARGCELRAPGPTARPA